MYRHLEQNLPEAAPNTSQKLLHPHLKWQLYMRRLDPARPLTDATEAEGMSGHPAVTNPRPQEMRQRWSFRLTHHAQGD